MFFAAIDWKSVFVPDTSPLEIIIRGSIVYIALFTLLRVVLKRQTGTLGMTDLLLITLIADASQNAMSSDYKSVPDGILLVGTIIFWNYFFDWLGYKSELFRKLLEPPPLPLVKDGRMLRRNMRQELISEDELMSQIRMNGCDDLSHVKAAYIESDGHISVVEYSQKHHRQERHPGT